MQIKGTINAIFAAEQVSDKFTKRLLWLNTEEASQYPQLIQIEFTQEKTADLDRYKAGDKVEVEFNLRGRQWKDKVFNTLQAWKIKMQDGQSASSQSATSAPSKQTASVINEPDDLPF